MVPRRDDGFAPLRDYAVIGNKRTAALVARDGSIDWLCLPSLAGPSVFEALLSGREGGCCRLAPAESFTVRRRYLPDTNVLETEFTCASGTVRVTDAMSRPVARGLLWNQVIRRVDGLAGRVPMRWLVRPRFAYGAVTVDPERIAGVPAFVHGRDVLAVEAYDVGSPEPGAGELHGGFEAVEGATGVFALSAFHHEPLTFSSREHILERLGATAERWRLWIGACVYDGPWEAAVRRSALALDLLVDDETGGIAAAATMGLPERVGGDRNYDYRYAWVRDTNLTLEAMLRLGFRDQVHTSLGWLLDTARRAHPELRPMYQLDGTPELPDEDLPLRGYRDSRPVVLGNVAQHQLQLGNYGDMLDMTLAYVRDRGALAPEHAEQLTEVVEHLCGIWRRDDSSIWELPDCRPYTQGKLACWLAFTHAAELAEAGQLPPGRAAAWRREADAVHAFVTERCWSERQGAYARAAGDDDLDAAVLLAARGSFLTDDPERLNGTIDAVRRELGAGGPLLYRYSEMRGEEGAFLACSFWLADALARAGRMEEAVATMDELVALANDVGLFAEEIDPATGAFLGNLPQALTHLALINAASTCAERLAASPD